ncbi:MAG: hypothetical protein IT233_10750 [Bacteroidia bacterium]|nr:hypothetical protein [Bacteroidia bacterium]
MKGTVRLTILFISGLLLIVTLSTCTKDVGPSAAMACSSLSHEWTADVQPLINTYCATPACHDASFSSANYLDYTGVNASVLSGSLQERLFELGNMPPASSPQLPVADQQRIRCWIEAGALEN